MDKQASMNSRGKKEGRQTETERMGKMVIVLVTDVLLSLLMM